jgi:CRISPR-associated protein Cmr6
MAIAAVPNYLGHDFSTASPGLRFGYYLQFWDSKWNKVEERALEKVIALNSGDQTLLAQLHQRQMQLFRALAAESRLVIDASATAPFTTGLGNEHPTENGFAFLNPYGLPYLPGSGVKGVVRQAVRELTADDWGEGGDWSSESRYLVAKQRLSMIDILLGKESQDHDTEHFRGVLSFWDVVPQIPGDRLTVEIMTPHQSHYYQPKASRVLSPHDSGQPTPITFLTVPPQSRFTFIVVCDLPRLQQIAPDLVKQWQPLIKSAFAHAFTWLGFGAKSAVGYGAMRIDEEAEKQRNESDKPVLSDEEKQIGMLEAAFAPGKKIAAGGSEVAQRQKLLEDAQNWSAELRKQAAVVIRATIRQQDWSKNKKKENQALLLKLEQ